MIWPLWFRRAKSPIVYPMYWNFWAAGGGCYVVLPHEHA